MKNEIWKDIPGYEEYYMCSDCGRVKSLERIVDSCYGSTQFIKGRLLKHDNSNGYGRVTLQINKIKKRIFVHQLVAICFLNHTPNGYNIVVDHIDNNKLNNRLDNLQLITARENCSKDSKSKSGYTGVYESRGRYMSTIQINKKVVYLGTFDTKEEASKAYQDKVNSISV